MLIFLLFIGKNKLSERRKGNRINVKGYVYKDIVIVLELYNDNNLIVYYCMFCKFCILF